MSLAAASMATSSAATLAPHDGSVKRLLQHDQQGVVEVAGADSAASSATAHELGERFVLRACLRVFRPLGVELAFHQGEFEQ